MAQDETKRALIVARTYPVPVPLGIESSCTAAITEAGEWLRLFPVPWRLLPSDQRFRKYQQVELTIRKAADDIRFESFNLRPDGIRVLSEPLASWAEKKLHVLPLLSPSLCDLTRRRDALQRPTLGVFKPASIIRLRIAPLSPAWSDGELGMLRQTHLFVETPKQELEKIPFRFIYQFRCDDTACTGHNLMCTDWEMSESFRQWRSKYGDAWQEKFRQRYETEMAQKYDTHFFVGTVAAHPNRWIIIGLFYPPPESPSPQGTLF